MIKLTKIEKEKPLQIIVNPDQINWIEPVYLPTIAPDDKGSYIHLTSGVVRVVETIAEVESLIQLSRINDEMPEE